MKMLKKLLAVVLTGAMALTLFTACGSTAVGTAVTDKDIADAMNDVAKAQELNVIVTPRAEEREMARKLAALLEGKATSDENKPEIKNEIEKILGYNEGGANEKSRFVWYGILDADKIGVTGQAYQLVDYILSNGAENNNKVNKDPANTRYMGTAFCKMLDSDGKLRTMRVIVATSEPAD